MKSFIAGQNEENMRLSRFIQSVSTNLATSLLYKYFRLGRIKVNGKKAKPEARLHEGDLIEAYLNDEFFSQTATPTPRPISNSNSATIKILWQNNDVAFLHKPAGLLCHSSGPQQPNLLDLFINAMIEKGEFHPENENQFSPALCNRIDRGTEGIVIAAKNYTALHSMNDIIKNGHVEKRYLCIVKGTPPQGLHTHYWQSDDKKNIVHIFEAQQAEYKEIQTEVTVLSTKKGLSLCEVLLITGRKHQIRSHLRYLGHPLAGDQKYGEQTLNRKTGLRTQALCAVSASFSDVPADNPLAYLNGLKVEISEPAILALFEKLTRA